MKDLSKATVQPAPRKNRLPKPISVGVTAALAVGGIALATHQAQALSALAVVNGITLSGGVGVSKNILYGDKPLQDLDIYYPKPLAKAMQSKKRLLITSLTTVIRWWFLSMAVRGKAETRTNTPLLVRVWHKQAMSRQ